MSNAVSCAVAKDYFDQFTGRCRLPLSFMQEHAIQNGFPVAVFIGDDSYLCKAHATRILNHDFVDKSIALDSKHPQIVTLKAKGKQLVEGVHVASIQGKLSSAASISLEPTNSQLSTNDINIILQNPIYLRVLQDACRRLILHEGCIVELPYPDELPSKTRTESLTFRVHRTLPNGYVRVVRATRVNLFRQEKAIVEEVGNALVIPDPIPVPTPVGGLQDELKKLEELIYMTAEFPDSQSVLGIQLPKGVLLSGPPGVGKTLLVRIATRRCQESGKCQLALRVINGAEIMSGSVGDAEATLRDIFAEGLAFTKQSSKHVFCLFLDELDALCPQRDRSGSSHSRIVAQLLTLMDGIDDDQKRIIVFGATNLPNSIDPALRRPGRFDRELMLRPPSITDRQDIFKIHLANLPLSNELTIQELSKLLAEKCVGFVGADIAALCRQACIIALTRVQNISTPRILRFLRNQQLTAMYWNNQVAVEYDIARAMKQLNLTGDFHVNVLILDDFIQAMEYVQASSLRGANTFMKDESHKTTWDDIGGLDQVKISLQQAVEWPLKHPETFKRLALKPPRGILLYGPPGCSKSTIVRACAYASQATFLSLSAAQVFSPYFGDAEAAIRQIFRDARSATPAIIFMDEIDAIVTKRDFENGGSGGSGATLRVLSTLLNEMDGVESADGLLVIGATNRPDMIDAALMRPGRFDRIVYVPLPNAEDRLKILKIHSKNAQLASDVDLNWIANNTKNFSGAELENLCREAALLALRQDINANEIRMANFIQAFHSVSPVSTEASLEVYKKFQLNQTLN